MTRHVGTIGWQEMLPLILILLATFHSIGIRFRRNGPNAARTAGGGLFASADVTRPTGRPRSPAAP